MMLSQTSTREHDWELSERFGQYNSLPSLTHQVKSPAHRAGSVLSLRGKYFVMGSASSFPGKDTFTARGGGKTVTSKDKFLILSSGVTPKGTDTFLIDETGIRCKGTDWYRVKGTGTTHQGKDKYVIDNTGITCKGDDSFDIEGSGITCAGADKYRIKGTGTTCVGVDMYRIKGSGTTCSGQDRYDIEHTGTMATSTDKYSIENKGVASLGKDNFRILGTPRSCAGKDDYRIEGTGTTCSGKDNYQIEGTGTTCAGNDKYDVGGTGHASLGEDKYDIEGTGTASLGIDKYNIENSGITCQGNDKYRIEGAGTTVSGKDKYNVEGTGKSTLGRDKYVVDGKASRVSGVDHYSVKGGGTTSVTTEHFRLDRGEITSYGMDKFVVGSVATTSRRRFIENPHIIREDVKLPLEFKGKLAFVLHNVFTDAECDAYIKKTEDVGYEQPLVDVGGAGRYYLPQIVQPEGVAPVYQSHGLARELGHEQSLPDPAFPNLQYLPTIPTAAKPSRVRPASGRGRVPALDKSRVKTAKQVTSVLAIHDMASTNKINQPTPPAGRKLTRARAPFARRETPSESSRQLNPDCALKSLSKSPADYKPTRASGTSNHNRLSTVREKRVTEVEIKKDTKPSRIPVLVRDGKACFNSSSNRGPRDQETKRNGSRHKRHELMEDVGYQTRCIVDSREEADKLYSRIRPHLPESWHGHTILAVNERLRFLRYEADDYFPPHFDRSCTRGNGDTSFITVHVYLNEVDKGGSTTFVGQDGQKTEVVPETGKVLVFQHDLLHEESPIEADVKYVLRADVMYGPDTTNPGRKSHRKSANAHNCNVE